MAGCGRATRRIERPLSEALDGSAPRDGDVLVVEDGLWLAGEEEGERHGGAGSNVTGLAAFSNSLLLVPVVNLYTTSVVLEVM